MRLPCVLPLLLFLAASQVAPAFAQASPEGLRLDDRRPEAPLTVPVFGVPVHLGGSWEFSDEWRGDFDLDARRARDRRVREHEVKLEARARPAAGHEIFLQAVALHDSRRTQGSAGAQRRHWLERGQAWWRWDTDWGSVQLGRLALLERRAWWWDDDLDALRLGWAGEHWRLESGLAREAARVASNEARIATAQRGVTRWFGQGRWALGGRQALEVFWLVAHDGSGTPAPGRHASDEDATDPSDLAARWLGLRASGEWRAGPAGEGPRLAWWADAAWLRGREALTAYAEQDDGGFTAGATTHQRLHGHALDLGASLTLPLALRPSLSIAWARGSEGFRQTGLQENKARLAGVKRLRRYGALLEPELANLRVATVGLGLRLLDNSSLELVSHRFSQVTPDTVIRGARLSAEPEGLSPDLGRELDLVLALRESRAWELTLTWSRLRPGAAFAATRRQPAHALEAALALNF